MIDPKLPGLETAVDDEAMRARFSALLACRPVDGTGDAARVRHEVLKHTIGKRCVIAYDVEDGGPRPIQIIGKLYRGARGARAFETQVELWSLVRWSEEEQGFGMAEPIAYLRDLGMVLQALAPGAPLSEARAPEEWPAAVRACAENLARLHALGSMRAEARSMVDHVRKFCRPSPEELVREWPELEAVVSRVLARALALDHEAHGRCVVHGDLGLSQVFVEGERAWFVDLDGLCRSHPALDVANFMVSLQMTHGTASPPLESLFLERYAALARHGAPAGLEACLALAYLRRATTAARCLDDSCRRERVAVLLDLAERAGGSDLTPTVLERG